MRKLSLSFAACVAACLFVPVIAQASPLLWLSNGKPIPSTEVVPVKTSGALTLEITPPSGGPMRSIVCKVTDLEDIQNGPNGGIDEMLELTFIGCKVKGKPSLCPTTTTLEVKALLMPWRSMLITGPPIRDEFPAACSKSHAAARRSAPSRAS